jgi:GntR family transcriptional regulator
MANAPRLFDIAPASGVPIYQQIVDQAFALVAGGRLRPGELLPSVRDVARQVAVNPMTVSKAYSQLESAGLVERVRGQGMRVLAPTAGTATLAERKTLLHEMLAPAVHRARQLGLGDAQVRQVIDALLKEHPP